MKKITIGLLALAFLNSCSKNNSDAPKPAGAVKAYQETWSWNGTLNYSPYTIQNNVWAGVSGSNQKVWANSASNWGANAWEPNTNGVKSYPNVNLDVNKKFSSMSALNSNYNFSMSNWIGVWDVAYDFWFDNYNYEIMVWEQWKDSSPISYSYNSSGPVWAYTNVNVGGRTYNIARGHTDHDCISFVATSQNTSGYVDMKAMVQWIDNNTNWGYNFKNRTLSRVGFGAEFSSTNGQQLNFTSNSYSLNAY
ncbi:hypothetical protein [Mucilaginibacter flavus]|uniref:hypothetical protein n=1 Tax=Mucilaginibacter flavus TaxID=931504 RepID=UPI0025B4B516|nr:hypothetical protein [Mucilaginibacter flavus]MDN3580185.1 hypothetical protein [Mucilaginibacter flavus]